MKRTHPITKDEKTYSLEQRLQILEKKSEFFERAIERCMDAVIILKSEEKVRLETMMEDIKKMKMEEYDGITF